jgi:hypothetical protein
VKTRDKVSNGEIALYMGLDRGISVTAAEEEVRLNSPSCLLFLRSEEPVMYTQPRFRLHPSLLVLHGHTPLPRSSGFLCVSRRSAHAGAGFNSLSYADEQLNATATTRNVRTLLTVCRLIP